MSTLYIREDACPEESPRHPCMLGVSTLLRELILRLTERPLECDEAGQDGLVVATLLGEIDWSPQDPLNLPPLNDPRLRLLDAAFAKNPGNTRTLDDWARQLQCSPRTLARLFAKEAGISFQTWRDQVRTFAALPMLAKKKPLAEIADDWATRRRGHSATCSSG